MFIGIYVLQCSEAPKLYPILEKQGSIDIYHSHKTRSLNLNEHHWCSPAVAHEVVETFRLTSERLWYVGDY
jgi:hypothetical protein